jgi:hypothetical protein
MRLRILHLEVRTVAVVFELAITLQGGPFADQILENAPTRSAS